MRLHDLIAHKGHADARLLTAVSQHGIARGDGELRVLFHHMLVANRFWLLSIVGEPFVSDVEMRVPDSFAELVDGFRTTYERERGWVSSATDAMLNRTLESSLVPGGRCTVSNALTQVCLHSQGHRSQCARMLRALGGEPPTTDFIVWVVERAAPVWPV
ncbi:MAG: DinB family protein [Vicinamibacterales bacterium]